MGDQTKSTKFVAMSDFLQMKGKVLQHLSDVSEILCQFETFAARNFDSKGIQKDEFERDDDDKENCCPNVLTKAKSVLENGRNLCDFNSPIKKGSSNFLLTDSECLEMENGDDDCDTLSVHSSSSTDTAFSCEDEVQEVSGKIEVEDSNTLEKDKNLMEKIPPLSSALRDERSRKRQHQLRMNVNSDVEFIANNKNDNQKVSKLKEGAIEAVTESIEIKVEKLLNMKVELVCQYCEKDFPNKSSLRQHIAFHRPFRPFKCDEPTCSKSYKTKSELNRHKVIHNGKREFECYLCNKHFLRKQYLKSHLLKHPTANLFPCPQPQCSKVYITKTDLDCHTLTYHRSGRFRYNKSRSVSEVGSQIPNDV